MVSLCPCVSFDHGIWGSVPIRRGSKRRAGIQVDGISFLDCVRDHGVYRQSGKAGTWGRAFAATPSRLSRLGLASGIAGEVCFVAANGSIDAAAACLGFVRRANCAASKFSPPVHLPDSQRYHWAAWFLHHTLYEWRRGGCLAARPSCRT